MAKKLFILGNGVDWCEKSLQGMVHHENVYLINKKIPVNGKIKTKIAKIYFSYKINSKFKLPFKAFWYRDIKKFIKENTSNDDELCILVYDHNVFGGENTFLRYLKKHFKNIKLAYIFTNIVNYTAAKEKRYLAKLNDWYDIVFAFDKKDAEKYNFEYSPLIYDVDNSYNKSDTESKNNLVFYVGQAKDRLELLLKSYEKLKELGVMCDFHIANVFDDEKKYDNEIVYNKFITYNEAVNRIKESTCLIDVIQGESTGLTIKTCEAVCYDKKLITTNKHVKEYPFYDPRYIRVMESIDDIDLNFFNENRDVHYSDEGKKYFSSDSFLDRLWKLL